MEAASWERFISAVNLKEPDRVPVCPWLGSDFLSGHLGISVSDWYANKKLQLRAMVEFFSRFPDAQYFPGFRPSYGATVESSALGSLVTTSDSSVPWVKEPVIKKMSEDIEKLKVPDPEQDGRMPQILEFYRYFAKTLPKHGYEVTSGFAMSPLDVAALVRNMTELLADLYMNPEGVHEILSITTETCVTWIEAQYESSGGTMKHILIVDDVGGLVSRNHWIAFSMPYLKSVVASMPRAVIPAVHNCGNVSHLVDLYPEVGFKMVQLGPSMDIGEAKKKAGKKICLNGNLPPLGVLLKGKPSEVEETCRELISKAGQRGGYILGTGGSVVGGTPVENLEAMRLSAERYGEYPL